MQPRTVLIVDDERHITCVLRYKLEDIGLAVITAHNGQDGVAIAVQERPDLIITDFQMPLMSGLEMAQTLRNRPETADTPLVMITARGHRVPADDLAATNVRELIPKPFSPRKLMAVVSEILNIEPSPQTS